MRAAGIDCLVLETGTRASTERRPRAGVIEERAVRGLERRGPARVLLERAQRHTAFESAGQSCGGRSRSRWSATLSASPTSSAQVPVAQRVHDPAALLAGAHEPGESQPGQVLTDRCGRAAPHSSVRVVTSASPSIRACSRERRVRSPRRARSSAASANCSSPGVRGCASSAGDRCMRALIRT
ncbi:hypothetical protein R2F25_31255 [Streptomyces sp. UP1A-1]|nr:hypothetical protein [Streptomyces sp. UP1A-1]